MLNSRSLKSRHSTHYPNLSLERLRHVTQILQPHNQTVSSTMATPARTLEGKVALVSGSSAGLGAAIIQELSRRGATVAINYPFPSEESNAESVARSLGAASKSVIIEADISTPDGPSILANKTAEAFGKIDILVNCAGINRMMSLDDPDDSKIEDSWDAIVRTNGRGTFFLTRAALKHLSRQDSRIINIGSSVSRTPGPDSSIYAGTKGMIECYTQCWATELPRKYGCTVNGVAPGLVGTDAFYAAPQAVRDALKPIIEATPVASRVAEAGEVAWTVAMLCEKEAGWLNGLYIPVSGGSSIF
ncbi:hypothetical protein B0J11DRAFT_542620 [Dendryphion nanum]|uniref:Uncharacterized protein n=1 Tax=Dendryphion nanum TaxID=256645 RepID=A0A9P9D3L6_9PLEO|nr:hypothetical protein B0J11DRAFT_542620 [Dendryphion nanum]